MRLPYGSWPSPLSARDVAAASPRLDGARFVGDDIWWAEGLADEGGRMTVRRRRADGSVENLLPAPADARSRVHEYGGGAWTADDDGELFWVDRSDQRVRALRPGGEPRLLTPADDRARHGGLTVQAGRLLAVRETHAGAGTPLRDIVDIPRDGSAADAADAVIRLAGGSDFVAHPALSPDGTQLAWIAWDHPAMPWDRSELRVGHLSAGVVTSWRTVAGGGSSPLQPVWTGTDELTYLDDPTGRWNLWRVVDGGEPHPLAAADADTGGGLWVLGTRWYAPASNAIVAVRTNGADEIVRIDASGVTPLDVPVSAGAVVEDARGRSALVSGAGAEHTAGIWLVDLDGHRPAEIVTGAARVLPPEWTPQPRALHAPGPRGPVHAFVYPPTHPEAAALDGELAPYVVFVHGGPTAHVGPAASARIAYLTSRGIGVLDVNYGGSTGYGRAYRDRLRGQWGVVDVEDVAAAVRALTDAGDADPARIAIAGGSAGGWTVLAAVTRTDVFAAGISRYGVGDARTLATDTHDFEARYLDGLIGPLPDAEAVYVERSPLTHPELFRVPMLVLQGADDTVVPPSQAEAIVAALARHGVPHAYILYEGEGHGFRRADTLVNAVETELAFLGAVFGFTPPGVAPLALD
jgi:dipeptidyl aminopeptidase/acylaminoacyl peptidase